MASTTSRGNYFKAKTKKYLEKLGYEVQLTEFMTTRPVGGGKVIYVKRDVFSSDGIAMNGEDIIFWNSKHATTNDSKSTQMSQSKKEYKSHAFPPFVKRAIFMWELRKKEPIITYYT